MSKTSRSRSNSSRSRTNARPDSYSRSRSRSSLNNSRDRSSSNTSTRDRSATTRDTNSNPTSRTEARQRSNSAPPSRATSRTEQRQRAQSASEADTSENASQQNSNQTGSVSGKQSAGSTTAQTPLSPAEKEAQVKKTIGDLLNNDQLKLKRWVKDGEEVKLSPDAIEKMDAATRERLLADLMHVNQAYKDGQFKLTGDKADDADQQALEASLGSWLNQLDSTLAQANAEQLIDLNQFPKPDFATADTTRKGFMQAVRDGILSRLGATPRLDAVTTSSPDAISNDQKKGDNDSNTPASDNDTDDPNPPTDTANTNPPTPERLTDIKKQQAQLRMDREKAAATEAQLGKERQELVDQLFDKWKSENGKEDIGPGEVLPEFSNNWFDFKKSLAYNQEGQPSDDYQMNLAVMEKMVNYRKDTVDGIVDSAIEEVALKNGLDTDAIQALAPGSVSPTSDYDITFAIPSRPELEAEVVKAFHQKFGEAFPGLSSGVLFDTNVYTNGFMTPGTEQDEAYIDKFNPRGKTADLPVGERALVAEGKERKRQTQMALSLVSVAQALSSDDWDTYMKDTLENVSQSLTDQGVRPAVAEEKVRDLMAIFQKAERIHLETEAAIREKKELNAKINPDQASDHLEANSKDELYMEALDEASQQIEKLRANSAKLQSAATTPQERVRLLADRAALITRFEETQGKALIYANESYFSGGAAIHVVKGMQGGQEVKLGRQQRMQSILMNLGYQIDHFNKLAAEGNEGRAILNTAKYGQRIADLAMNPANGIVLSDRSTKTLQLAREIISEVKKDDVNFPSPSEKEQEALRRWNDAFPETPPADIIRETYKEVGQKSLAPFIADKISQQQQEMAKLTLRSAVIQRKLRKNPNMADAEKQELRQRLKETNKEIAYNRFNLWNQGLQSSGQTVAPKKDSPLGNEPSPAQVMKMFKVADLFARAAEDARKQRPEAERSELVGYKTADEEPLMISINKRRQSYRDEMQRQKVPLEDQLTDDEVAAIVMYSSRYFQVLNDTSRFSGVSALNANPMDKANWKMPDEVKIKQKDDEINALTDDQKAANAERLSDAPQLESNVNKWRGVLVDAINKLNKNPQFKTEGYDPKATVFRFDGKGDYIDKRINDQAWSDKAAISTAREVDGALQGADKIFTLNIIDDSVGADIANFSHYGPQEKEKLLIPGSEFKIKASLKRPEGVEAKDWINGLVNAQGEPSKGLEDVMNGLTKDDRMRFKQHIINVKAGYAKSLQGAEQEQDPEKRKKLLDQLRQMETIIWSVGTNKP